MITPIDSDVGREVWYVAEGSERELGVITSFNAVFVFVRFGEQSTSKSCRRDDLVWADEIPLIKRIPVEREETFVFQYHVASSFAALIKQFNARNQNQFGRIPEGFSFHGQLSVEAESEDEAMQLVLSEAVVQLPSQHAGKDLDVTLYRGNSKAPAVTFVGKFVDGRYAWTRSTYPIQPPPQFEKAVTWRDDPSLDETPGTFTIDWDDLTEGEEIPF